MSWRITTLQWNLQPTCGQASEPGGREALNFSLSFFPPLSPPLSLGPIPIHSTSQPLTSLCFSFPMCVLRSLQQQMGLSHGVGTMAASSPSLATPQREQKRDSFFLLPSLHSPWGRLRRHLRHPPNLGEPQSTPGIHHYVWRLHCGPWMMWGHTLLPVARKA